LLSFGSTGIVDQIRDDEAEVRVGSLRLRERLSNLELIDNERRGSSTVEGVAAKTRKALRRSVETTELHLYSNDTRTDIKSSNELNLIGKKTDEAIELTDKFLDEAFLNGISELRIIHGQGTGALRKAISELLADHPHVARFASASQDHGGSGATIVELKQ